MSARHGSTQTGMSSETVWDWAVSIHGGHRAEGVSIRARGVDPVHHILVSGERLWCSGSQGDSYIRGASKRHCKRCAALAAEMHDEMDRHRRNEPTQWLGSVSGYPRGDTQ